MCATTGTFPQLIHSTGIHGVGGGGGEGALSRGEECGVNESSATEEYFRVAANHQSALAPVIGGQRIPNSTVDSWELSKQTLLRHTVVKRLISSLSVQGKTYLLIYTYTYNHCAYYIYTSGIII